MTPTKSHDTDPMKQSCLIIQHTARPYLLGWWLPRDDSGLVWRLPDYSLL